MSGMTPAAEPATPEGRGDGAPGSELKHDLSNWDPENPARWNKALAWRTLWITTYAMILGFATWYLVSAIAPRLNEVGFDLDTGQLYWLVATPGLAGGLLRLVFMFMPPILGTRLLVSIASALLLLPMIGWTIAVRDTDTPYWILLALAFSTGIGGGSFAGFMPSTSYFFPKRMSGTALGLQAGIGNFGISLVQFLVPWVVGFGLLGTAAITPQSTENHQFVWLHNGGLVLIPWVLLAIFLAAVFLRRVPVSANFREQMDIFRLKHTWIMTIIYAMSFGLYAGLAAQLSLIIKGEYGGFDNPPDPLAYAFIGPALGALVRAACGPLCDRFGGGIFTFIGGIGMAAGFAISLPGLAPSSVSDFGWLLTGMLIMFFFSGFANAGTFKQMPMIFPKRQAGGAIGWTSAIGAFGPFLLGVTLAAIDPFLLVVIAIGYCVLCVWLTWWYYVRRGAEAKS